MHSKRVLYHIKKESGHIIRDFEPNHDQAAMQKCESGCSDQDIPRFRTNPFLRSITKQHDKAAVI